MTESSATETVGSNHKANNSTYSKPGRGGRGGGRSSKGGRGRGRGGRGRRNTHGRGRGGRGNDRGERNDRGDKGEGGDRNITPNDNANGAEENRSRKYHHNNNQYDGEREVHNNENRPNDNNRFSNSNNNNSKSYNNRSTKSKDNNEHQNANMSTNTNTNTNELNHPTDNGDNSYTKPRAGGRGGEGGTSGRGRGGRGRGRSGGRGRGKGGRGRGRGRGRSSSRKQYKNDNANINYNPEDGMGDIIEHIGESDINNHNHNENYERRSRNDDRNYDYDNKNNNANHMNGQMNGHHNKNHESQNGNVESQSSILNQQSNDNTISQTSLDANNHNDSINNANDNSSTRSITRPMIPRTNRGGGKNNKKGRERGGHHHDKEILKRVSEGGLSQSQSHQQQQNHSTLNGDSNSNQPLETINNQILGIPVNPAPTTMTSISMPTSGTTPIPRIDSVASISMMSEKSEKDAKAGSVGAIDLLKHKNDQSNNHSKTGKKSNNEKKDKKDGSKKKRSKQKSKKGQNQQNNNTNDEITKQRAAKAFNNAVRKCVERSDPDGLYDLLHDKKNHKFALHADVLEIVLKAFVVAAMFDEALYCLRNCTRPGTLSTWQAEKTLQCLPQNLRNSSAYVAADMINALCIATEFDKPTHRTYFMRVVRGIALEFLEEATSARDRICSAQCERLVRSSVCIVDAQLRRGKKPADIIVLPGNQLGVFSSANMENRGIQAGDAVGILPYAGPYPMSAESLDRNMIEATVTGIHPMVLRLQDKTNTSLFATLTEPVDGNVYRIDKLANRMGFNRQLSAVVAIASPLEKDMNGVAISSRSDARRPSPELIKAITAMDENIDRVMINGNISHKQNHAGEITSTAGLCAQPVPFYTAEDSTYSYDGEIRKQDQYDGDSIRDAARLALEKYGSFEGLNASQRLAVEGAATNRLTLVQGPPGTGKTAVAIRIIQHWARLAASEVFPGQNPKPILATSDSNIAVDNLVEGCANVGLKVIRLGRPEAIRPELLRYCIDRPQSDRSQTNGDGFGYGGGQNNYGSIYKEKIKAIKSAHVICCTCIGSGADILDNISFERVLVDEATQATEPAVLVPLTRLCRQLVLVGDHCQLPPTVLSTRAEEEGVGVPLFSRMVACGVPPFMLDTQYRMHPSIAMFPSDLFYGGKLLNGVSAPERRPLAGFPWPREEFPVAFVPVPLGVEIDDGVSKMNEAEAAAACDAVEALLKGGQCSTSDVAVVTPYAAQVRLIRRLTRKLVNGPPYVEVSSTDGFQGREKEAVVFSAVRSNDYGSVGFVSDWRRINVSFTRARRGLIVIGNDVTLRRGDPETWMPWLEWVNAHGVNMDKPGKMRGRYDAEQLRRVRGGTTAAEMLKDVLARQQMQLQKAEKQIQNAEKKSSGQIIGAIDGATDENKEDLPTGGMTKNASELSLKNDLALLSNAEGNWDDSDDDENNETNDNVSPTTFTSLTSTGETPNEPQDAWDL